MQDSLLQMWIFSEDACLDHRPLHWTQGRLPTRGLLRAPRPTPHRERQVRPHQEPQDPRHPYRGYVVSIKPIIVFQIITFPFLFSCSSKENYTLEQPSSLDHLQWYLTTLWKHKWSSSWIVKIVREWSLTALFPALVLTPDDSWRDTWQRADTGQCWTRPDVAQQLGQSRYLQTITI